ncbi:PREDICTED: uncharacterized protein LOC109221121 [Nicotiana attenuata]|uniref:uncharacterized protein LOC109221121 n=1 Tax=Nicotiana attenuata TaxID=49451 RepID=UPI000904B3BF|nr:PREDICTED: uncharacterized protein LOC109221121 [Nicotiana attenuata]
MECIKTVNYTVLVRQGDPISPFVFAIVMEYLSRSLNELKKETTFQYHPRCRKLGITHMSFADDLLLFAKGDLSSIVTMYNYFSQFSEASGLQANLGKSLVYFGGVKLEAQLFILPVKVLKMIEALCRSYVWSGSNTITKKAFVSWEKMCTPKSVDGLNLINLSLWNKAAIAKIYWGLAHKEDKLWIRWINAYYIKQQQLQHMPIP